MKSLIKLTRALWTYRQPITRTPPAIGDPVSDLFIWRSDQDWKTFFELTDIESLFEDSKPEDKIIKVVIFDHRGNVCSRNEFVAPKLEKITVDISNLTRGCRSEFGTFCVLHERTPGVLKTFGNSVAERGYVSYRYKNSPIRSFVHGNLDAITGGEDGKLRTLGGASLLRRKYKLQCDLLPDREYDLALLNSANSPKKIVLRCKVSPARLEINFRGVVTSSPLIDKAPEFDSAEAVMLAPGESHLFTLPASKHIRRVEINSRLVMARPVVFCKMVGTLDVFHG